MTTPRRFHISPCRALSRHHLAASKAAIFYARDPCVRAGFGAVSRHLSEQYFTSSHTRSHFLRQTNGRAQVTHSFCGSSLFFRIFGMAA
jgi:hypothetical protein